MSDGRRLQGLKALFDTNVLVAALVEDHRDHTRAFPHLDRALSGVDQGFVSTHGLAETYSVLTTLPIRPRITPRGAREALQVVQETLAVVPLGSGAAIDRMKGLNLSGGGIYDALHAQAALKSEVDAILTLNPEHFTRLGANIASLVQVPSELPSSGQ